MKTLLIVCALLAGCAGPQTPEQHQAVQNFLGGLYQQQLLQQQINRPTLQAPQSVFCTTRPDGFGGTRTICN